MYYLCFCTFLVRIAGPIEASAKFDLTFPPIGIQFYDRFSFPITQSLHYFTPIHSGGSMKSLTKWSPLLVLAVTVLFVTSAFAQNATVRGRLTDVDSGQPLVSASVLIVGTTIGAASDADGNYVVSNIPPGAYNIRATYLGYTAQEQSINLGPDATLTVDFALKQTVLQYGEVIVEVNRARERETPVAFTDIGKEQIDQRIHGQDAPLLLKGTPGLYAYSTDGVGNGEAKLFVRGFNQNYVQVLINGVPTNDPESNSVYWSNWGSVSSAAASVQVQRGAGSSLYGAGAFGGSFNIVTGNARPTRHYGVNLAFGDPQNTMYGVDLNSGLIADSYAASLRLDRKIGEGNRLGSRYEGYNYYLSASWFIDQQQSLKLVLHGAPQEHTYSFSNNISFFKFFGYSANTAPWLSEDVVNKLPVNATTGAAHYGLTDGVREMVSGGIVGLSHNHFQKPQIELHYGNDLDENTSIRATFFFSRGRGGGSSLNSSSYPSSSTYAARVASGVLGSDGALLDTGYIKNTYLSNAYQRDSYSWHQQGGLLANVETKLSDDFRLTLGGEFRSWTADHPGYFTNLYGKTNISAQQYGRRDTLTGAVAGTFRRRTFQGDVANGDMTLFGTEMVNLTTFDQQYRNYRGETPQFTIFANANYQLLPNLNIIGTLQYVWYKYDLTESMPSENAIGQMLTSAQIAALGLGSTRGKGPDGNGKFYMKEYVSTVNSATSTAVRNWYAFDLVNASRSRGFIQPKFGLNYNVDENFNVFGSFAHVERFVDLSVYYNSGRVNPDAGDEKSNQIEGGVGYTSRSANAKLNVYSMTWDNKSARIQDVSKAGEPGYDRNGFRTILVGSSSNQGVELEFNAKLDEWIPVKGFEVRGSATMSSNIWTDVLESVKKDPTTGARQVFNSNGSNAQGVRDTVYMDELKDTHVGGPPQQMASFGVTYRWDRFFVGIDANYYAAHWGLDGDTYVAVDGEWNAAKTTFTSVFKKTLPRRVLYDLQAGYRFDFEGVRGYLTAQVLNLFDKVHLADVDNFGVQPGIARSLRFNVSVGI